MNSKIDNEIEKIVKIINVELYGLNLVFLDLELGYNIKFKKDFIVNGTKESFNKGDIVKYISHSDGKTFIKSDKYNYPVETFDISNFSILGKDIFIGDILEYCDKSEKIKGIFNETNYIINVLEYIVRNYILLNKSIFNLSDNNKKSIIKLFQDFNII